VSLGEPAAGIEVERMPERDGTRATVH
jgi:hypothetical protein